MAESQLTLPVNQIFPAGFGFPGNLTTQRVNHQLTECNLSQIPFTLKLCGHRRHWFAVGGYGLAITAAVLGALALALQGLGMAEDRAVTISFLTLACAQLWHVFNMRDRASGLFRNSIARNPAIWGALALCVLLLIAAVYVPPLADVLSVVSPGPDGWALVLGMSLIPLALGQASKYVNIGNGA